MRAVHHQIQEDAALKEHDSRSDKAASIIMMAMKNLVAPIFLLSLSVRWFADRYSLRHFGYNGTSFFLTFLDPATDGRSEMRPLRNDLVCAAFIIFRMIWLIWSALMALVRGRMG